MPQAQPTPKVSANATLVPLPREGMVATFRHRRAVITQVTPFDGLVGRLHLVAVDYADLELPPSESLLWEREVGATLTPPKAPPDVAHRTATHALRSLPDGATPVHEGYAPMPFSSVLVSIALGPKRTQGWK